VALLEAHGTQISMAAVGRPGENAYAERVIRTLKEEEVYLNEYENKLRGCVSSHRPLSR